jgi:hypothetical protein
METGSGHYHLQECFQVFYTHMHERQLMKRSSLSEHFSPFKPLQEFLVLKLQSLSMG